MRVAQSRRKIVMILLSLLLPSFGFAQDALPKVDEAVFLEYFKNPQRIETDKAFAQKLAENYSIRLYRVYMESYMKTHNLKQPPVPFSTIQPIIDSAKGVPHPILIEMIQSRFGAALVLPRIMTEITEFEKKKGVPTSINDQVNETVAFASQSQLDEVKNRLASIEAGGGKSGWDIKDIIIVALAVISFGFASYAVILAKG
jgi:hypothetical protein